MGDVLSIIEKIAEFFSEQWEVISEHWKIFLIWSILLILLALFTSICVHNHLKKQYIKENKELKSAKSSLQNEYDSLKEDFDKLKCEWLVASRIPPSGPAAAQISEAMQNEDENKDENERDD